MPFSTRFSSRTNRIVGSLIVATLLIGGAYISSGQTIFSHQVASAESTDDLLKSYAAKDSDGDGLPDWEEALYGTDPNKAISNPFGIPDGEAVAEGKLGPQTLKDQLPKTDAPTPVSDLPGTDPASGSVTEQFSEQFLQAYMAKSNGQPLSDTDQQDLVNSLLQNVGSLTAGMFDSHYTIVSIHTNTSESVLTYAGGVEDIIQAHDVAQGNAEPITLMQSLLENSDESARTKLKTLSDSYAAITKDLVAQSVPPSLAANHLMLIQSFDSLAKATAAVTNYEKDPVAVLGSLKIFQPASQAVLNSLSQIAAAVLTTGEPAPGTPGAMIVNMARSNETQ